MTRSLSRWQAALLGLVVLAGLALGSVGLFAVGSRHWVGEAFALRATFADVAGVEVGTRVHVQGIDAGEVEAIDLPAEPGSPVQLRIRLAEKFRPLVRADSPVEIGSASLLSGKVLRILPGSPTSPPIENDAQLAGRASGDLTGELARAATRLNNVLAEAEKAVQDFQQGRGPVGDATADLKKTTAKLDSVLARADATLADVQQGKGTLGLLLRDDTLYNDLSATLNQVNMVLEDVRYGKGTVGQLLKSNEAYAEAVNSLKDVRQMVTSVKQNADAIKAMPVVRSYVVDVNKELNRPDCQRHRMHLPEHRLFEPGRAVLTDDGRRALDAAAQWLNDRKEAGSEVVVAAFADPRHPADFAQTLSQKQADVVLEYLREGHSVHRMGYWWWSNRTTRAIGCGSAPSPVPESETLPAARVELIVFVPEN